MYVCMYIHDMYNMYMCGEMREVLCTQEGDPGDLVARNGWCFPPGESDELNPNVHDLHLLHSLDGLRVRQTG